MQLININDAAQISGKSVQTIRRMIKRKKIQVKKQKTPQGFNYLVLKESLDNFMKEPFDSNIEENVRIAHEHEHQGLEINKIENFKAEVERFTTTVSKLIEQSERDKENFFGLIKTFQDRNLALEERIRLLEAPKKKWWQW